MICERNSRKFCCEDISNIENYDKAIADKENMWDCHHRLEIQGPFRNSKELLIRCGVYYNVPASQLIFLREDEHIRLHHCGNSYWLGKHHTDKTKRILSEQKSGSKNPSYGKHPSEETLRKRSLALKGKRHLHSEAAKLKMSKSHKGKTPWNKGRKMTDEYKKKLSQNLLGDKNPFYGTKWFNNGVKNIRAKECPEGFKPGRIKP